MMIRLSSVLILLLIISQGDVFSQQRMQRMQEGRDRLETLRQVRMIEALDLDDETAARLTVLDRERQAQSRELQRHIDDLHDELEAALDEEKSEAELRAIRSQIQEKRNALHENRIRFYRDAEEYLTPRQVAKLMVFERNFTQDIREYMREVQRERRRRR